MRTRTLLARLAVVALPLFLQPRPLAAQTTEADLKARLVGKPLFLRGLWMEDDLKFDTDGQPLGKLRTGSFTESAIDVHRVKLVHGQLRIDGQRVGLAFSPDKSKSAAGPPQRVAVNGPGYDGSVRIEIAPPPDGNFSKALDAVFAPDLASLVPAMPTYWQDYARKHFLEPGSPAEAKPQVAGNTPGAMSKEGALHVGGAVQRPYVLHQVEPTFSGAARLLRFSGNVVVYLWLLPDGSPSHLRIAKPAGLGLDEQALYAVSQYKFKPATKDGKPVTVDLYVEVNFQNLN